MYQRMLVPALLFGLVLTWTVLNSKQATNEEMIRQVLQQWPTDFNAGNKERTLSLFATDLLLCYQGLPDRDYAATCKHLSTVLENGGKRFRYDAPLIEEIRVSGDLAVVRLTWTLNITDLKSNAQEVVKERGMDVFKRQKDGSWKVSISYSYPDDKAPSAGK